MVLIEPDGTRHELKPVTAEEMLQVFQPYGAKLGFLVFIWNRLHDRLSQIFNIVVASPAKDLGYGIWYSTDSDFAQRKMLRSAVEIAKKESALTDRQAKDIMWILNHIDESLRHKRNDALHAPLGFTRGIVDKALSIWVEADWFSQNPRAKALRGKNLLTELDDYSNLATVLADFAAAIYGSLRSPAAHAWPDKPKLPHAHRKKNRKESSGQSTAK